MLGLGEPESRLPDLHKTTVLGSSLGFRVTTIS